MTAPTTGATPKIALDQRASSRHDGYVATVVDRASRPVGASSALLRHSSQRPPMTALDPLQACRLIT